MAKKKTNGKKLTASEKEKGLKLKKNSNTTNKKSDKADTARKGDTLLADEAEAKESFFKSTIFILILSIVAFLIVVTIIFAVALKDRSFGSLFGKEQENLDYKNDSLSDYIDIKESDYRDIEVYIAEKRPDAKDVELEINRLLATYRKGPKYTAETWSSKTPLKIGDEAFIYYVAYTTDEDGRKFTINEASNHDDGKTYKYTVGTGKSIFGVGFDDALVGKIPQEHTMNIRDTAYVTDGCVAYATVSYVMDDGTLYDNVDVCMDLNAPDFEDKWGVGAKEMLINSGLIGSIVLTGTEYETFVLTDGRSITYTALTVNYVTTGGSEPYTVESVLPYDYSVEELRGKKVLFDVFLEKTVVYDVYDFDEDFITNKIGISDKKYNAEEFEKYEGDTPVEKYRSYIKFILDTAYDNYRNSYAGQVIWNKLMTAATVKEYPKTEVDNLYITLERYYQQQFAKVQANGGEYESFDEYMAEVYELGEGGEWTSVMLAEVKETVKERLIVYAVLRDAGILPGDEEFKKIYEDELLEDFNYANTLTPGKFKDLEEYRAYVEEDLDYEHSVYYYYVTEKLIEMVEFKYPE